MALAKIKSIFSPSTTIHSQRVIRKNPPRKAHAPKKQNEDQSRKQNEDHSYPSPSENSSIVLGTTVTLSQTPPVSNAHMVFVQETQSPVLGNNSITLTNTQIDTIEETQTLNCMSNLDTSLDNPCLTPQTHEHLRYSDTMFNELSRTMSDDMSIFPLRNEDENSVLHPPTSTPVQTSLSQTLPTTNGMKLLVTESQLPPSQSASQKHENVLKQLICANSKLAQLEAENKKLKEDLQVIRIHDAAQIPKINSQTHAKTQTCSITQSTTHSISPDGKVMQIKPHANDKLLFRSRGNLSILSNFHPMHLTFRGQKYHSAEQAYQHHMAFFHSRPDIARRIMSTRNPGHVKKIAKSIKKCEQWHEHKAILMADILLVKANQCQAFRTSLLDTGTKVLVHNIDTDSYWGCGSDLQGCNMLGVLLMELRKDLVSRKLSLPSSETPNPQHINGPELSHTGTRHTPVTAPPSVTDTRCVTMTNVHLPKPTTCGSHIPRTPNASSSTPDTRRLSVSKSPARNSPSSIPSGPNARFIPVSTPPDSSVLLIGNSNVREMAPILNKHKISAQSTFYPGGTLKYICSRMKHFVNSGDPTHVVLMAGDIETVNGMAPEQLTSHYQQTVREIRRVFPWSRLILVGLTISGNQQRQQATRRLNALLQHLASVERMIDYIDNRDLKLRDNIHLSFTSKRLLGTRIANFVSKPYLRSIQRFR